MRTLYIVIGLILTATVSYSQEEVKPIKSPDLTTFMNVNYMPANEYTGKLDITIPIYSIDLDGLEIPISISYNTGGVNINSSASRVGLNWTLNAGGVVSKEVAGYQDTFFTGSLNSETGDYVYSQFGYLMYLFDYNHVTVNGISTPVVIPYQTSDTQPDQFFVVAPGLTTRFTHQANGTPFELVNTGSIIKSPFQGPTPLSSDGWPPISNATGPQIPSNATPFFNITSPTGFVYQFADIEYGDVYTGTRPSGADVPQNGTLMDDPWPANVTGTQVQSRLVGYDINYLYWPNPELFPNCHLTSITNPVTNKKVRYYYTQNMIVDVNRRVEGRVFNTPGGLQYGQTNYEHDLTYEQVLDKIVFPEGTIDFYYQNDRTDVLGGKRLTKIEVRNSLGKFIKGIVFEQDYFTTSNCTDPQCQRLRLNGIKFVDKDNNVLPGYSFDYNTVNLPKRYSLNQDFTGYYNGDHGQSILSYVPMMYYSATGGKNLFLPFPSEGYSLAAGNAPLTADINYAKAGSLQKITYPTGGYSMFDYELNSFVFLGSEVQGGGLRILSETLFDDGGNQQRKISYDYKLPNGLTSGTILNLPRYYDQRTTISLTGALVQYCFNQLSGHRLELTDGSYVGYSSVKTSELNNGYTLKTYTGPADFPNLYGAPSTSGGVISSAVQDLINQGLLPTLYQNTESRRGKLLTSQVYDNNNNLIKSVTNQYVYSDYQELPVSECYVYGGTSKYQDGNQVAYAKFDSKLVSESNLLLQTITTDKTTAGDHVNEVDMTYDPSRPLARSKTLTLDQSNVVKESYLYAFDPAVASLPQMTKLNSLNILTPVQKNTFKNATTLSSTLTNYNDFGDGKILPSTLNASLGSNPLEVKRTYVSYDRNGNVTQYVDRNGVTISILWGYNYLYKIAEVIGATFSDVLSSLGVQNADYLQILSNDQLAVELNKIRSGLPSAQVKTFTHIPLVGVNSITDINGRTTSFTYDSFDRLVTTKDNEGNITTNNSYNYKLKPTVTPPVLPALSLNVNKEALDDYHSVPVATTYRTVFIADANGGGGDYAYEWRDASTNQLVGTSETFLASLPCQPPHSTSYSVIVKVTDQSGTSVTQTVSTDFVHECDGPFYVDDIAADRSVHAGGGSWNYSYTWSGMGGAGATTTTGVCPFAADYNNSSQDITYSLTVTVTDLATNQSISKSRTITVKADPAASCFVAGTKIRMADNTEKNIEDVRKGELVLTYNTDGKIFEIGEVEEVVSPSHPNLVELEFENGIKNTNTYDHPYYVKDKGWASHDPQMTKKNYNLDVNTLELGDVVFVGESKSKPLREIRLIKKNEIHKTMVTYNLSKVSKNHDFFANGILVHNKSSVK